MCDPVSIAVTSLALAGAGQMQQYQAEKDRAAAQELKNKQARKSANIAYLADLAGLDRKKAKELKEQAQLKEGKEKELIKKQDKALLEGLESGNANVEATLRDVGFDYESTFNEIAQKTFDTNIDNIFGYTDAYAAMRRSYNQVPDVFQPSKMGLAIGLGSSAVDTYSNVQMGKYGQSSSSDLDTGEIG